MGREARVRKARSGAASAAATPTAIALDKGTFFELRTRVLEVRDAEQQAIAAVATARERLQAALEPVRAEHGFAMDGNFRLDEATLTLHVTPASGQGM